MLRARLWLLLMLSGDAAAESLPVLSQVDMFDVGLALIDGDDRYDIYTINHQFAESILINNQGDFILRPDLLLGQTTVPGSHEPVGRMPVVQDGLNVFAPNRKYLMLLCQNCPGPVNASLQVVNGSSGAASVELVHTAQATAHSEHIKHDSVTWLKMSFQLESNGLVVLSPQYAGLHHHFVTDVTAKLIHIGPNSRQPDGSGFTYTTSDNHSAAWTRVNADQDTDVYMSSGGLRGRVDDFPAAQLKPDPILRFDSSSQNYRSAQTELVFSHHPARIYQAAWLDVDLDGDLDFYQGNRGGANLLWIQQDTGSGQFVNQASQFKLNPDQGEVFQWYDLDLDGRPELLTLEHNQLFIYAWSNDHQTYQVVHRSERLGRQVNTLNSDIQVAHLFDHQLPSILINANGRLKVLQTGDHLTFNPVKRQQTGLPKKLNGTMQLIDANLDGQLDFVDSQTGVWLAGKHRFKANDRWSDLFPDQSFNFRQLLWFDADDNGRWDVLEAASYPGKPVTATQLSGFTFKTMKTRDRLFLHRNVRSPGNWLQIDLKGTAHNQHGIGSRINIISDTGATQHRQVWGDQDSLHSQGHYRQYIGLGKSEAVDVVIHWPDGQTTRLADVKANQKLLISHPGL